LLAVVVVDNVITAVMVAAVELAATELEAYL
jgi:hypothetical protein